MPIVIISFFPGPRMHTAEWCMLIQYREGCNAVAAARIAMNRYWLDKEKRMNMVLRIIVKHGRQGSKYAIWLLFINWQNRLFRSRGISMHLRIMGYFLLWIFPDFITFLRHQIAYHDNQTVIFQKWVIQGDEN